MNTVTQTPRTTLRRLPARGSYDRAVIDAILDEAYLCHLGFTHGDHPFVIPTMFGRVGDRLVVHGSAASRMMHALQAGVPVCATVTLVDGLVLARSAFHHSMNYRSVVILGTAVELQDREEKLAALEAISEHIVPGRWAQVRGPSEQELKATSVLAMPINEASAKVRVGPPLDDEADLNHPCWAGVIPLRTVSLAPVADPLLGPGFEAPVFPERGR